MLCGCNKIREEMWWELVSKNIFEGFFDLNKKHVQDCVEHLIMSKEFENYVWEKVSQHKMGYATARVNYLLDAFQYDDERILMNRNYEVLE